MLQFHPAVSPNFWYNKPIKSEIPNAYDGKEDEIYDTQKGPMNDLWKAKCKKKEEGLITYLQLKNKNDHNVNKWSKKTKNSTLINDIKKGWFDTLTYQYLSPVLVPSFGVWFISFPPLSTL